MNETISSLRFRSGLWFFPVFGLVFLAFVLHGELAHWLPTKTSTHSLLGLLLTVLPLLLAAALTQQIIRARSAYSSTFSTFVAVFFIVIISAFEFLLLLLIAMFVAPSSII